MHETRALEIVTTLQRAGHIAYYAGGYVRDMIMGHPSDDIDIATTASPEEVQALFPKTIPVGIQFGIVVVVMGDHQFEVATFRKEEGYKDGRRPTAITAATPEEDAQRRDLTINGLFYDPLTTTIHDFVDGRADIENRLIRAIGNPKERFQEDRLRMIRAVRYAARFHFAIEKKTKRAIVDRADTLFPAVAIERVWQEFEKMARFSNFPEALIALNDLGLLPIIFPTVKNVEERVAPFHHYPKNAPLIAYFLHLAPDEPDLCSRFKLSNETRSFVTFYTALRDALKSDAPLAPHDWAYRYASPHFPIAFDTALAHFPIDTRDALITAYEKREASLRSAIRRIKANDPVVKAKHLIERGLSPGPELGRLLRRAEEIAIDQNLDTPDAVLKKLLH